MKKIFSAVMVGVLILSSGCVAYVGHGGGGVSFHHHHDWR